MPHFFISYRRNDSGGHANGLYLALCNKFGKGNVFFDTNTIQSGEKFPEKIREALNQCDILLVVISNDWLNCLNNRLNDPNDYVRLEVETGLKTNKRVIPLLFDGAMKPKCEALPKSLADLDKYTYIEIRNNNWNGDIENFITTLQNNSKELHDSDPNVKRPLNRLLSASLLALVTGIVFYLILGIKNFSWEAWLYKTTGFSDYVNGPDMRVIPKGEFRVGAKVGDNDSGHTIRFERDFAIGKYEITFDQYEEYLQDINKNSKNLISSPFDEHYGKKKNPVINVTWEDAVAYTVWLSKKTNKHYRLPSETEWEYVARAGEIVYWWDNYSYQKQEEDIPKPVGERTYDKNDFGLYDTAGNVSEWVKDVWKRDSISYPHNGTPVKGNYSDPHVIRGGAYDGEGKDGNVLYRAGASYRGGTIGFRVARDLY